MYQRELQSRDEYFPSEKVSRKGESLAQVAVTTNIEKPKPMLLLVEDNKINLQVYFPRPLSSVQELISGKASQYIHKEEQLRLPNSRKWLAGSAGFPERSETL